jgi:hypothetical protein
MLAASMNGVDARAPDGARGAAPRRGTAALGALGLASCATASVLVARGELGAGAVAAALAGAALTASSAAGHAGGRPARWTEFGVVILGRVPDAAVMTALAWHARLADRRVAALAVSAVALTFLAAYARTRALALGWRIRTGAADPLRYAATVAALAVPGGAEPACWILCALTFVEFVRVAAEAWREAERA